MDTRTGEHFAWMVFLGCKSYICAVGIGVENYAKQNKAEDFHEVLVANLIVNSHFLICKSPYTIE